MQVIANERGFFGAVREPGEEFEVPDDTVIPAWFSKAGEEGQEAKISRRRVKEKQQEEAQEQSPSNQDVI